MKDKNEDLPMWPTPIVGDAHLTSTPEAAVKRVQEGKLTLSRVVVLEEWPIVRGQNKELNSIDHLKSEEN